MVPAPLPGNEAARLKALRRLLLLDTPPEARYDRIVQYVAALFDVPMALISLVDEDRQWFKASVGLQVCETTRDVSFCGHAILAPEVMVVPDARTDPRFHDNPLVTGAPYIRFYAGAPLRMPEGELIGTLCILDTRPRRLDASELAHLGHLRGMVVEMLGSASVAG